MKDSRISVRVPADLVERLKALALNSKVRHLPELALLGSVDTSKVARVALLRGVLVLEAEVGKGRGAEGRSR